MSLAKSKLALLNDYRAEEGLDAYKDWRAARHQPQLDAYTAKAAAKVEELRVAREEEEARKAKDEPDKIQDEVEHAKGPSIPKAKKDKKPKADGKLPTYKEMANYDKSSVAKPFEVIHGYLDAHPNLTRKEAVQNLVNQGINYSTARTQYQRWFSKNKSSKG